MHDGRQQNSIDSNGTDCWITRINGMDAYLNSNCCIQISMGSNSVEAFDSHRSAAQQRAMVIYLRRYYQFFFRVFEMEMKQIKLR